LPEKTRRGDQKFLDMYAIRAARRREFRHGAKSRSGCSTRVRPPAGAGIAVNDGKPMLFFPLWL
jgi:hypothetical protein